MVKIILCESNNVRLFSEDELLEIFRKRNFFLTDEDRQSIAKKISEREGVVEQIEEKYAFDYFYFLPDGDNSTYSIPYQAVREVKRNGKWMKI